MAVLPVQVIDMWRNPQRIHPVSECPVLSCFPCWKREASFISQSHTTVLCLPFILRIIIDCICSLFLNVFFNTILVGCPCLYWPHIISPPKKLSTLWELNWLFLLLSLLGLLYVCVPVTYTAVNHGSICCILNWLIDWHWYINVGGHIITIVSS